MKNHFNIKKLTIFTFIFMCFFAISNKVEALTCTYNGVGGISSIRNAGTHDFVIKKDNGSISTYWYDIKNKKNISTSTSIEVAGYNLLYDKDYTKISLSKNECPKEIYYFSYPDPNGNITDIDFSYFTSKDESDYKTFLEQNPECEGVAQQVGISCGNMNLKSSNGDSKKTNKALICKYSGDDFIKNGTASSNYIAIDFNNFSVTEKKGNYEMISPTINIDKSSIGNTCPAFLYHDYSNNPTKIVLSTSRDSLVEKMSEMTQDKITIDINTSDSGNTIKDRCSKIEGIKKYFTIIFNLLRYAVPAIIIIVSSLEFAGVVLSGEDEKMEKAKKHFIVRLIIGVVILLVPFLLEFVLRMAGMIDTDLSDIVCNIF